jgi:hypothetical protein
MLEHVETRRYFGVEEANRLVPHLTRTFGEVRAWLARLEALKRDIEQSGAAAPRERLVPLEAERATLAARIRLAIESLEEQGLEVKAVDGLVDFHAQRQGEVVYLCWRFGEEAVTHWHPLDTGFAGRKAIRSADEFARTYAS